MEYEIFKGFRETLAKCKRMGDNYFLSQLSKTDSERPKIWAFVNCLHNLEFKSNYLALFFLS